MEQTPARDSSAASSPDEHVERSQDVKAVLQRIIDELGPSLAERPSLEVRERLVTAIADAGLPEQPAPWVESTVAELSGGRGLVMDARFQSEPQGPGPSDPESQG